MIEEWKYYYRIAVSTTELRSDVDTSPIMIKVSTIRKRSHLIYSHVNKWSSSDAFAGFSKETGELNGYALLTDYNKYAAFSLLRTEPDTEKKAINAAMVVGILQYYQSRFDGYFYISNGSPTIRHETAFQDYLEQYFDFRKAYCKLNVKYKLVFGFRIKILYPFR